MLMSQYILRTGNNIVVMVDNDGKQGVESWAGKIANVWRTAPEIKATWQSVTTTLDQQYGFEVYSGEGAWNDPGYIKFDLPLN
jgi:alpha-galactosidase